MSTLADSQRRHQKSDGPILQQKRREEAGAWSVDANKIGTYEYHKRAKTYQVEVFLLPVETVERLAGSKQERGSG